MIEVKVARKKTKTNQLKCKKPTREIERERKQQKNCYSLEQRKKWAYTELS